MPFMPFHLGVGALFKAIGKDRFSFTVFAISQVLIDVEPTARSLSGDSLVHGPSHSVIGALAVGTVAGAIGKPLGERVLNRFKIKHQPITWPASFVSAFVGTYSHIVLDVSKHRDMSPLWPFMEGNPLLGTVSVLTLHIICVAAAALGIAMLVQQRKAGT